MSHHLRWSIYLGRWAGVPVRLHAFFIVLALCSLYVATLTVNWLNAKDTSQLTAATGCGILILFASVVLHELAHIVATWSSGGHVEGVVIGPTGGLVAPLPPRNIYSELAIFSAGPMANFFLCLVASGLLLSLGEAPTSVLATLNPLSPAIWTEGPGASLWGLRMVLWINWLLLLVNLLPVPPFDGGRLLRCLILIASPETSRRQAEVVVVHLARGLSLGLVLAAWFLWQQDTSEVIPSWFALMLLAVLIYCSARVEQRPPTNCPSDSDDLRNLETTEDLAADLAANEDSFAWPFQDDDPEELPIAVSNELSEEEIDAILIRVHEHGLQSLSNEERDLLDRASEQLRQRQRGQLD